MANYRRLMFFRNLQTALYVSTISLVLFATAALLYWNVTGMPKAWCLALEKELSKHGIEATIKKLRYVPLRGIEATEVEVFVDESRSKRLAYLERLIFDMDKTKAMRGIIRLTHIDLLNAELRLPVDPDQPEGDVINISHLNGQILLSKNRKFEIKQGKGLIDGIQLTVDAVILGFRPMPAQQQSGGGSGLHRKFLREFVKEINQWQLDPLHPPELTLKVDADATKWSALKCQFDFSCNAASRGEIHLKDVRASGNVFHSLVSVHHVEGRDARGKVRAALDYDLSTRKGNFDIDSTFDLPHWIHQFSGRRMLDDFSLAEAPEIQMRGQFSMPEDQPMSLSMQGRFAINNALFRGSPLASIRSEFSYRDGDFYFRHLWFKHARGEMRGNLLQKNEGLQIQFVGELPMAIARPLYRDLAVAKAIENLESEGEPLVSARIDAYLSKREGYSLERLTLNDIVIDHPRGKLTGMLFMDDAQVSYELESTFPPEIWRPFFPGQTLEKVLGDFSSHPQSRCWVKLNGKIDRKDRTAWSVDGQGKVENLRYRQVPVHSCFTKLQLKHHSLRFSDIAVDFDYSQYDLQKIYQGGVHGPVQAALVSYDHDAGMVQIQQLRGNVYPVPLLNMFAVSVADAVSDYRFHTPPSLTADGSIDVRDQGRTQLKVTLQKAPKITWEFLGDPVTFSDVSTELMIDSQKVVLNRLSAQVFGGTCAGSVTASIGRENRYNTEIRWNALKMADISEAYHFEQKGYGTLTGRISLAGIAGVTQSLEGEGLCSLEKGELFAVPVFGPLSPVISTVLADRRAGFERAKDAFSNFVIRKGVIETNDFTTYTTSLKFTGNGKVDLHEKTVDMTMRMNARGLLGIVVLPFQPIIKGLFQFHGQGPMNKPKWEHVIFTSPPDQEKNILLRNLPLRALRIPE
ncbi:MAG: AsmA-like C-terminal region-containing protein [Akkermansiaceae bacterium]